MGSAHGAREPARLRRPVWARLHPSASIERVLETFGLAEPRDDARRRTVKRDCGRRSRWRGRCCTSRHVLLLDEPTSGLDPEIRAAFARLLEERRAAGCAILVSTHNLDEAERLADRVAVLQRRLLALDRPAALRQRLTTGRLHRPRGRRPGGAFSRARADSTRARPSKDGTLVADAGSTSTATRRSCVAALVDRGRACARSPAGNAGARGRVSASHGGQR